MRSDTNEASPNLNKLNGHVLPMAYVVHASLKAVRNPFVMFELFELQTAAFHGGITA